MQLTMSRQKSKTGHDHCESWIFWCNQWYQGQNPKWWGIIPGVESSDAINKVKAKFQDMELAHLGFDTGNRQCTTQFIPWCPLLQPVLSQVHLSIHMFVSSLTHSIINSALNSSLSILSSSLYIYWCLLQLVRL